jgi:hypothetical protein
LFPFRGEETIDGLALRHDGSLKSASADEPSGESDLREHEGDSLLALRPSIAGKHHALNLNSAGSAIPDILAKE